MTGRCVLARFLHSLSFRLTLAAVFAAIAAAGLLRDEVRVVVSNATILCFSCIGIK
jgi:hypothetical protein